MPTCETWSTHADVASARPHTSSVVTADELHTRAVVLTFPAKEP